MWAGGMPVVRMNSKKERTAKATTKMAREMQRQTQLMEQGHQAPAPPTSGWGQPQIQPVPTVPPPGYQPPSVTDELERLADMYQRGVLSADEFEAAKAQLLT